MDAFLDLRGAYKCHLVGTKSIKLLLDQVELTGRIIMIIAIWEWTKPAMGVLVIGTATKENISSRHE